MCSRTRACCVFAVVLISLLPLSVAIARYHGAHPYESGRKSVDFGAQWHQYRLSPTKPIRKATVKVEASSPGLWVCAVAAYKDSNGQWNSISKTATTSGNVRYGGCTRITLDLAPDGTIGWLTITVENRHLPNSTIWYSLSTY